MTILQTYGSSSAFPITEMVPSEPPRPKQEFSHPRGCLGDMCTYTAIWTYNSDTDTVTFVIRAKQSQDLWTGIGFAPDTKMVCQ